MGVLVSLIYDTVVPIKAGHLAVKPRAGLDGVYLEQGSTNELVSFPRAERAYLSFKLRANG
jgi:hypothetical protein